jgi:hypothetical protein
MTLWKTLIRPDREENPEQAEVSRAANLLQIGEFQFLQLAYFDWFGEDMSKADCNRLFAGYMLYNQTPHWVRHYSRQINNLDATGKLNDNDPAYHRYDANYGRRSPGSVLRFCGAVTIITVFIGGGIWMSHQIAEPTSQVLPPYFSDQEISTGGRGPIPVP